MAGHWGCLGSPSGVGAGLDFKNLDQVRWLGPRQGDHLPIGYQRVGVSLIEAEDSCQSPWKIRREYDPSFSNFGENQELSYHNK